MIVETYLIKNRLEIFFLCENISRNKFLTMTRVIITLRSDFTSLGFKRGWSKTTVK